MRKLLLLTLFVAAVAPLKAQALITADDTLAYVAMPLAVSDVCDVRGVQTDQVASLAGYMDQAQVSPEGFIDVFRYAPVALVYSNDRRPDFVQWVGSEVDQGVTGDQLVSAMEGRLRTYGDLSIPRSYRRRYEPRYYDVAFEPDYVPLGVRRYCERELLDPFALIDMPIAVTDVCDLGVPYDRVGRLVVELDLGDVAPWQTVELLRYSSPALVEGGYYGQPDFAQFVYDQRVGGLRGYPLVQVASQQLTAYGVAPQIDPVPQTYIGRNSFAPVAQSYMDPISPAFVPQVVRTRVSSGLGSGRTLQAPLAAPVVAASPQVTRLLGERGPASVVTSPGQARRELAQTTRAEREATRGAYVPQSGFPVAQTPQNFRERGGRMVPVGGAAVASPPPGFAAARGGEGRHEHIAAPGGITTFAPPAGLEHRPTEGGGRGHVAAPRTFVAPPQVAAPPQVMERRGREHVASGPPVFAQPRTVEQPQVFAQPPAVDQHHVAQHPQVVAQPAVSVPPPPPQQHGHGGPPPQAAVAAAPAPQPAVQGNGHGQGGPPAGNPPGQKKKGKDQ
jgi:hypothetical protein